MTTMTGIVIATLLVIMLMIYALGHWMWRQCQRQRAADAARDQTEEAAANERREIRAVAEAAASEAAACAAVIDRIGKPAPRRKLEAVRDHQSGVSTWRWE